MPVGKMRAGLLLMLVAATLAACASSPPPSPRVPALRVGVPRESPPYAFSSGQALTGLEVEFARELATALGRRLELRDIEWNDLVQALVGQRVDLIMGGMTITPAREVQMAFSDPYLRSGLLAVMRRADVERYTSRRAIFERAGGIGVIAGTTGERFVRERSSVATISTYQTAGDAIAELRQHRVDVVVHDAPVGLWFVSRDEANLAPLLQLLNEENLGWAMRRGDDDLRTAVNGVLARWRTDGTRDRILTRWLPYWQRLESTGATR